MAINPYNPNAGFGSIFSNAFSQGVDNQIKLRQQKQNEEIKKSELKRAEEIHGVELEQVAYNKTQRPLNESLNKIKLQQQELALSTNKLQAQGSIYTNAYRNFNSTVDPKAQNAIIQQQVSDLESVGLTEEAKELKGILSNPDVSQKAKDYKNFLSSGVNRAAINAEKMEERKLKLQEEKFNFDKRQQAIQTQQARVASEVEKNIELKNKNEEDFGGVALSAIDSLQNKKLPKQNEILANLEQTALNKGLPERAKKLREIINETDYAQRLDKLQSFGIFIKDKKGKDKYYENKVKNEVDPITGVDDQGYTKTSRAIQEASKSEPILTVKERENSIKRINTVNGFVNRGDIKKLQDDENSLGHAVVSFMEMAGANPAEKMWTSDMLTSESREAGQVRAELARLFTEDAISYLKGTGSLTEAEVERMKSGNFEYLTNPKNLMRLLDDMKGFNAKRLLKQKLVDNITSLDPQKLNSEYKSITHFNNDIHSKVDSLPETINLKLDDPYNSDSPQTTVRMNTNSFIYDKVVALEEQGFRGAKAIETVLDTTKAVANAINAGRTSDLEGVYADVSRVLANEQEMKKAVKAGFSADTKGMVNYVISLHNAMNKTESAPTQKAVKEEEKNEPREPRKSKELDDVISGRRESGGGKVDFLRGTRR